VSEEVNRKLSAMNTVVQLSIRYTERERHRAHRYGQTDQTDGRQYDANSRSYCVVQYDRLKVQSISQDVG